MGTKHLNALQRAEIGRLHAIPTPSNEIAAAIGCSIHQVRHAIHRMGMTPNGSKGGACYAKSAMIRELAGRGESLSEIARRVGTNKRLVKRFLTKHDIPHRPFRQTGSNNPAWKGGRQTDKSGYILVHRPDHPDANRHGYVRAHRLVMEEKLGRRLEPGEVVHHRDGDRANNVPDNLELFPSNGVHLAETLKGQTPNWSESGLIRLLEASRRGRESPKRSNRSA